ncbi:MAG: helix-turn-helix transcriptional regulator [Candidatus Aminicenantes bacterium]|jgi:DNA-binding PadR family transcriptional regulator
MILLTKQEELFMLTIFRLEEPAYLVNIRKFLFEHTSKDWAFGSLYITLDKLRKKGFVETYTGKPRHTQGGKAIQYYRLTKEGLGVLAEAKRLHDAMWEGFSFPLSKTMATHER